MTKLQKATAEYAKLQAQIAEIELKKSAIAVTIKSEIEGMGATSLTVKQGIFTLSPNVKYVYSKKVQKLEKDITALKEDEKESGKAERVINSVLVRFTPNK